MTNLSYPVKTLAVIILVSCMTIPLTSLAIVSDTTSYIHTVDIATGEVDTLLVIDKHFEAPNWHPDNYLILNSYGRIYKLDLAPVI